MRRCRESVVPEHDQWKVATSSVRLCHILAAACSVVVFAVDGQAWLSAATSEVAGLIQIFGEFLGMSVASEPWGNLANMADLIHIVG